MATAIEINFIQCLTETPALRYIVEWDLPLDLLPTEALRTIHEYALNVWDASGGTAAPSADVVRQHFENLLAEHEVPVEEESTHPVESVVHDLRSMYIRRKWGDWVREAAGKMATADVQTAPEILDEQVGKVLAMQSRISRVSEQVDLARAAAIQQTEYERRVAMREAGTIEGAIFGLPVIDQHTGGIKPGELAVFAAPPKTGKSWMLLNGALHHWRRGGSPVIFTLENSVEMTLDRLAVLATGIDSRRFAHGELNDAEKDRLRLWHEEMTSRDNQFHILQPERGKRTMEQMVRRGRVIGDALYIDQLTFVESSPEWSRKQRWEQVGLTMHDCKALITSGDRIPCILAHQINREGQKAAEKAGRLEMYHLAEAAEVERTADWGFGLWQSRALRDSGFAWFQSLAARREDLIHWEIQWRPWMGLGQVRVRGPINLDD